MLPKVTSWIDADSKTQHRVTVIHVDLYCQCNDICTHEDVILVYAPRLCTPANQKVISLCIPLDTFCSPKRVFNEFVEYESLQRVDAGKLHAYDKRRTLDVLK